MLVDLKNIIRNKELSSQCMMSMDNGTPEEVAMMMYELCLDRLDDFRYKGEPSEPIVLCEFKQDCESYEWKRKSESDKKDIMIKIYNYEDVKTYFEEKMNTIQHNLSNAIWLEHMMKGWSEWEETEKRDMCWQIYRSYPDKICMPGGEVLWRKMYK